MRSRGTFPRRDYAEGNREAWRALEDAYKAGKLRSIGVSNFKQHDLQNIMRPARSRRT